MTCSSLYYIFLILLLFLLQQLNIFCMMKYALHLFLFIHLLYHFILTILTNISSLFSHSLLLFPSLNLFFLLFHCLFIFFRPSPSLYSLSFLVPVEEKIAKKQTGEGETRSNWVERSQLEIEKKIRKKLDIFFRSRFEEEGNENEDGIVYVYIKKKINLNE